MTGRRPRGTVEVVVLVDRGAPERLVHECIRRVRASRRMRTEVRRAGPKLAAGADPAAVGGPAGPRWYLELPWYAGLGPGSLAGLAELAGSQPDRPVNVLLPGARDGSAPVRLRHRAVASAGPRWEAGSALGIIDLRRPPERARVPLLPRIGRLLRGRMPPAAYSWLASGVKVARRRVRNYLFLD